MPDGKHKNTGIVAVYRPLLTDQLVSLSLFLLVIGFLSHWLITLINAPENMSFVSQLAVLPLLIYLLWMIKRFFTMLTRDKFVITVDGLSCVDGGIVEAATWDEVDRLDWKGVEGYRRWGVITKDERLITVQGYARVRMTGFATQKVDLKAFRETEAGQHLYYYAPHLFDSSKKKKNASLSE